MKKMIFKLAFSCSLVLFFAADTNAQKTEAFNIPEDLGKGDETILVSSGSSDRISKAILEAFKDNYKGKFEASPDQYNNYSNYKPEKFQYVFIVTEKFNPGYSVGKDRFPATVDYKFILVDVRTGKRYEQNFWSGSYKKGAKSYVKKMEEIRKKNAGS